MIEVYKCAVLTLIAALLAALLWHTPMPLTMRAVRAKKIKGWQNEIPLLYVQGSVDVDNTVAVEVSNTVDIEGTVSIDR